MEYKIQIIWVGIKIENRNWDWPQDWEYWWLESRITDGIWINVQYKIEDIIAIRIGIEIENWDNDRV
jgi:hypothetical protein